MTVKMSYDNVILEVGNFGRYQRRVFMVLILPSIACGFHKMGGVFLAARADFRCLLPHEIPDNATYQLPPNITNLTPLGNETTDIRSQCERYDTSIVDHHHAPGGNITSIIPTVKCDSFVYDKTYYTKTATTEFNLVCDDAWLKTLSESLFMMGDIPGSVICGSLSDRYGRKAALLWGSIMQLVFASLVAVSPNFSAYTVLRVLVGATTSSLFLVVYVTAVEMVCPKNRNTAGVILNLAYAPGYLLSAGLAYFIRGWRYLQIVFTVPTIVLLAFSWSISESPRWLLTKGRVQEAKDILRKVFSENGINLSADKLDSLLSSESKCKPAIEETSVFDLLKYPNLRKKSLVLFFIWFVSSVTYYGLAMNTSNLGGNDYVNFSIAAAVEIPAYLTLLYTSDRWGRKTVLCGGMLAAGISLLLTLFVPVGMTWLLVLFAMIGKLAISCAWVSSYVFTAEQYPTSIRNVALACCSAIARIAGALAPHINFLFEISTYLPFAVLGSSALIAGLISLLLPETLNKKLPESMQDAEQLGKEHGTIQRCSV